MGVAINEESFTVAGICENSLDCLVFESLIPKPILQRYVSLLMEHRRIILSGPSGTGKTYLANRLSEYMVLREGRELADGIIATFNVDHKSSKVRKQIVACTVNVTICQKWENCSFVNSSKIGKWDFKLIFLLKAFC